jgi:hypothetical protein
MSVHETVFYIILNDITCFSYQVTIVRCLNIQSIKLT